MVLASAWLVGCVAPAPPPRDGDGIVADEPPPPPPAERDGSAATSDARAASPATGSTGSTPSPAAPADADAPPPPPPSPPPVCPAGAAVHAFSDGERWRYSTSPETPAGFADRGIVFRLASAASDAAKRDLYLLYSAQADDYLVSLDPDEGQSLGYGLETTLGQVFVAKPAAGAPLLRYVKPRPELRHYLTTDAATAPPGFEAEHDPTRPMAWACPASP